MAGWRRAVDLAMTAEEIETLTALSRSRTEAARHVERAQMLLAYRQQRSFFAVGQRLGVHHQTVQRCVERALAYGAQAAFDDRPRPGKEPTGGGKLRSGRPFEGDVRLASRGTAGQQFSCSWTYDEKPFGRSSVRTELLNAAGASPSPSAKTRNRFASHSYRFVPRNDLRPRPCSRR